MPNNGPFPSKEDPLFNYVKIVIALLLASATRFGLSTVRQTALTNALNLYTAAYNRAANKTTRTKNDILDRNTAKKALIDLLRATFKDIPASALTPGDRTTLNLLERSVATPKGAPTTKPVILSVGADNRLQHSISFVDEATPNSKAKPANVLGCEVWCAVGVAAAPPADTKNYRFLALDTATPYVATFDSADGGKIVWYILRWINPRGQTGPWSTAEGAVIRP